MFGFLRKKQPLERICGNCRLFNPKDRRCSVVVLHEGQKYNIPMDAEDECFFEQEYFDPIEGTKQDFNEIKEIKMWVENEDGKPSKEGNVKIELPDELEHLSEIS